MNKETRRIEDNEKTKRAGDGKREDEKEVAVAQVRGEYMNRGVQGEEARPDGNLCSLASLAVSVAAPGVSDMIGIDEFFLTRVYVTGRGTRNPAVKCICEFTMVIAGREAGHGL